MTISVCLIVKNEEHVLERCLDSLEGLYEELVIVDTGSTDRTKEIAAKYTDCIYDYHWINDFSDARNYAFSKCTQDYIYSVDADEVLNALNRERFLELKNALIPEIEIVQMWYLTAQDAEITTENYDRDQRPKLFKRLRTFTWIDPIHESVNLNPVVYDSEIEILHMPVGNHAKRDFHVFESTIEKGLRLSKKLLHMYARELFLSGTEEDFLKAESYFKEAVTENGRDEEELTECFAVLAKCGYYRKDYEWMYRFVVKNIASVPCAEICCILGDYYLEKGDYEEASVWYLNAFTEAKAVIDRALGEEYPKEKLIQCYENLAEEIPELASMYYEQIEGIRTL